MWGYCHRLQRVSLLFMDLENHRPRELPSHPLVVIFFFACVGICVDRAYGLPPTIWWGLAVCALFGWLLFRFHRALGNALLCIAVAASMGCWHHSLGRRLR